MPSQILHSVFAEDVIAGLYNPGAFRGAFYLGCQGPDIFYHSQRHKPVALEYGTLLHRRNFGVFAAGLLQMAPPWESALGAYALGFMTHAALDRHCHPYIMYRCDRGYHSFYERIIDVLMLKQLRNQDTAHWAPEELLASVCENPPNGLKELICSTLAGAFPERIRNDYNLLKRIDNTFIDCARFYRLTSPAGIASAVTGEGRPFTRRALNYIYPENLPSAVDFLNMNHKIWRYPYLSPKTGEAPKEDCRSFPEIYADALKVAADTLAPCITQFLSGAFSTAEAAEVAFTIGNSGLAILNEEGKPCAPNMTDPLPLEEVLDQQAQLRGIE